LKTSYGKGVGRKRQNTDIWGRESKIAKKKRHMIFERSLIQNYGNSARVEVQLKSCGGIYYAFIEEAIFKLFAKVNNPLLGYKFYD